MTILRTADHEFEIRREMVDATLMRRPDTSWRLVDAAGHEHRWHADGSPAQSYSAVNCYTTPTLLWVKDGEAYWPDDDEPHDVGHLECRQCGEHVAPGYTADTEQQMIPGLTSYHINGVSVPEDEFKRRFQEARQEHERTIAP